MSQVNTTKAIQVGYAYILLILVILFFTLYYQCFLKKKYVLMYFLFANQWYPPLIIVDINPLEIIEIHLSG